MIGLVLEVLALAVLGRFTWREVSALWAGRRTPLQDYAHRHALLRDQRQRRKGRQP